MKNLKRVAILLLVCSFRMAILNAQTPEPTFINSDKGLQKNEILRLQMKDDLKLTDAKFDSALAIQKEYLNKFKQVKTDKKLTEDARQKKIKDLSDLKKKRLKSAGLDDTEAKKVEDYFVDKQRLP